nr:MAG TPA_asm: hypothetical protein [Caudoviricetes sp.]
MRIQSEFRRIETSFSYSVLFVRIGVKSSFFSVWVALIKIL